MYLLRKVRRPRWEGVRPDDPEAVAKAAEDLRLRDGEEGLSVSQVTEDEARTFAMHWASVHQDSFDKPFDFVLVPESLIPEGAIVVTSDGSGDPLLEARHREIKYEGGFTPETLAQSLIRGECKPVRIPRSELQADAARRRRGGG